MIVWLASYPRSGNTFFRVLLNSVFNIKTYSIYDDRYDIGADKATSDIVGHEFLPDNFNLDTFRKDKKLYIIKTHELLNNDVLEEDKIIYLMRDGRESTLSFWKYGVTFVKSKYTLNDVIATGGWGKHISSWSPHTKSNTLLIKFENLIDNPSSYLEDISNFIKINAINKKIPTFNELKKINPKFFRSGQKDSWKNEYSNDNIEMFWSKNHIEMIEYGYNNNLPKKFKYYENPPKVTIVTVSYNTDGSIERTIKSVLEQTYPNIEYIIIDGKSTDNTVEIIKKHDNKISYWISEKDDGIYYAMNKAIDLASGVWINFMNAGDTFIDKSVISKFINIVDSSIDVAYGTRYIHKEKDVYLEKTYDIDSFYIKMPFGHQSAFTKKSILKKYKFDTSLQLSADYDFLIQCYQDNCKFQNLDLEICNFYAGGT